MKMMKGTRSSLVGCALEGKAGVVAPRLVHEIPCAIGLIGNDHSRDGVDRELELLASCCDTVDGALAP
jgi:hypothetical protein